MTYVIIKRGILDTEIFIDRRRYEETKREDDHLQTKDTGLKQILPSQSSVGTNSADTLISGLSDNKFPV